jgi:hypothetical protein
MRRSVLVCLTLLGLASAAHADCSGEVAAAFEKQRNAPAFRMTAEMTAEAGDTKMTVDYLPPDRMRQRVERADLPAPLETVAVGNRAWGNQGGGFEELQPQFAQAIIAGVRQTLVDPPQKMPQFTCLGKTTYEGRPFIGYRSEPAAGTPPDKIVDRTIYINEKTGLPAMNVVAKREANAKPLFKGVYTYPTDIVIEPIEGAPVAVSR